MLPAGTTIWTPATNFDDRSFHLNDEANLNVYDRDFALAQVEVFERDRARSHQVTLRSWKRRPLREKLLERGAWLLHSQL